MEGSGGAGGGGFQAPMQDVVGVRVQWHWRPLKLVSLFAKDSGSEGKGAEDAGEDLPCNILWLTDREREVGTKILTKI